MTHPPPDRGDQQLGPNTELLLVTAAALLLSFVAFAWFYRHGDTLLYGDAVAHLNIARRLTDARDPGWAQLGSVWLPLPHLLAAPFVANDWLWRTGIGGSIPSMLAYVLGVVGIYRLVRFRTSISSALLAAVIYALNPSLLYMQSTAMTESIFLAAVIWSIVYFDQFRHALTAYGFAPPANAVGVAAGVADNATADGLADTSAALPAWQAIERCGCCLAAAIFTRYDGWILAFVVALCAAVCALLAVRRCRPPQPNLRRLLRSLAAFVLLLALCPTLWLAHNYKAKLHPLDWLNGPYSAKAIAVRSSHPGDPPYPGQNHPRVAAQYFLKAARMNTGEGSRESWLMLLTVAGTLVACVRPRRFAAWLLLWIPLPFYAYAIAYGSVPIFVPEWWPFSYYNVRYGLELLPAVACFAAILPWALSRLLRRLGLVGSPQSAVRVAAISAPLAGLLVTLLVAILAYSSSAWCFAPRSQLGRWDGRWMIPICYREAWVNGRARQQLETQLADQLAWMPANATILMYTSDYVGAIQRSGVPLNRVIGECTNIAWDSARSAPFAGADYVVAISGDPVSEAVRINPRGLTKLAILHTLGQPDVSIYRTSRP